MRTMFNILSGSCLAAVLVAGVAAAEPAAVPDPVPTHADAAVILAKFSGLFDRYVDPSAGLNECVAFLNKTGIYFGLLEVVNGSEFKLSDCARAMGQIDLILAGEAEYAGGKVKLPKGIDSWEDYCIMNGVKYTEAYQTMLDVIRKPRGMVE
ncbi:MAG: hypothetical protein K9M54_06860 [Kiritimatiellales bacterium]|nr:hypothetical protein [Kiritimatiellales bacterium]MCF7863204.1 hypothetical protein [Kiritimatiellales bacterium]